MYKRQYDNYDGSVVTHGTNTLAFSSAALSFALPNLDKPVVLTGAQVPFGVAGSDASLNLQNAIRVAAHEVPRVLGVVTVFGSYIISGVKTRKRSSFALDAFAVEAGECLGRIGTEIEFNTYALEKHHCYLESSSGRARFANKLKVYADFNTSDLLSLNELPGIESEWLIKSIRLKEQKSACPLRGAIICAFGAGDSACRDFLVELNRLSIPVVIANQSEHGKATMQVNEPGKKLFVDGLAVPAFDMTLECLTVKFSWLLGQNFSYTEIQRLLVSDLRGEIDAPEMPKNVISRQELVVGA